MSWIAHITITCFLASYAVALGLEMSRLFFRSGVRGALMLAFGVAGLFAQTLYLGHRAANAAGAPLSSEFDFYLIAAWVLAATYLYLTVYHPHNPIGLFLLPLVILFVAGASLFASDQPFQRSAATRWWGIVHGICLLLGTVAVTLGFVSGCMYLLAAYRLKKKISPGEGLRLPSLEWSQKMNARTIGVAVIMLVGGFLSGIVLNLTKRTHGEASVPWTDPVVVSSALLVGWMVIAWLFSVLYKPAQQGRKVAYLTIASFVFLLIALIAILAPTTQHGASPASGESAIRNPQSAIVRRSL